MPTLSSPIDISRHQRRVIRTLSAAQVLSGIGAGAVVSTGSLLAVQLSGSRTLAGSVATTMTLGAALASAALARIAIRRGRRIALSTGLALAALGSALIILAATLGTFWLLILGAALMGCGNAANLQSRFAATDLSQPSTRGRDLSLVVWMSTVGAVAGPNLVGAGGTVADALGLPTLTGLFLFAMAGMLAALTILWWGLRRDPSHLAPALNTPDSLVPTPSDHQPSSDTTLRNGIRYLLGNHHSRGAMAVILSAHAVMVAVMSMTPVHMDGHGASVTLVGLTVSLHIAGMYALAPLMGMAADRWGAARVSALGLIILAVSVLVSATSGASHTLTTAALILLGLGWSAATVAGSATISTVLPPSQRVQAQGASDTFMSLAGGLGGLLAGLLLSSVGYAGLSWVSLALLGITCAYFVVTIRKAPVEQGDERLLP